MTSPLQNNSSGELRKQKIRPGSGFFYIRGDESRDAPGKSQMENLHKLAQNGEAFIQKVTSPWPEHNSIQDLIVHGNACYLKRQYSRAIAAYDQVIDIHPSYGKAYINRGAAYASLGKWAQAIADYNRAIDLFPDGPEKAKVFNNRGNAQAAIGNLDQAIEDYGRTIALSPNNAAVYINRGAVYAARGDWESAIADYDEAAQLEPGNIAVYNNRGAARANHGDFTGAIVDFRHAVSLQPEQASGYYNLACVYALMKSGSAAVEWLIKAVQRDSSYREKARHEGDFDAIRSLPEFQVLFAGE